MSASKPPRAGRAGDPPAAPRKAFEADEAEACDCCSPDCDCGDCERCSADVNEVVPAAGAPQRQQGPPGKGSTPSRAIRKGSS